MPRLIPAVAAALACACGAPAAASAGWFPADPIDGPAAGMTLGDLDLARDGTGAVVYTRLEDGVPHVFLSRHVDGAWRAPERVDPGVAAAASQPVVAAADAHRLLIAWIAGGKLYGSFVRKGAPPGPLSGPRELYADADPARAVTALHAEMGINGTGYVVFTAPGAGGSDVRALRLQDDRWELVGAPLDVAGGQAAGDGAGRPRVAVAADGNAVVTWGEGADDGRRRVYGRRVTGLAPSVAPQEVSLPGFDGAPGGTADSPEIDIEDDGSFAWVVWRQDFGDRSRGVARRLVGSLFEAPAAVDGGQSVELPRVAMSGRGLGMSVAAVRGGNWIVGSLLVQDAFGPAFRVDVTGSGEPVRPAVGANERDHVSVAWRNSSGAAVARYRDREDRDFQPEAQLSRPENGPVPPGDVALSDDRAGNTAVAFLQGVPEAARLVVAEYDRPPGRPIGRTSTNFQKRLKPRLKWGAGSELWGPQTFRVFIDGKEVASTQATEWVSPVPYPEGRHTWQLIAVDRRGQQAISRTRPFRLDATPPKVVVKVTGTRRRMAGLRFRIRVSDRGSGVKRAVTDFGDRTGRTARRRFVHRYGRAGTFRVRVRAVDRSGNVARKTVRLRIR